LPCEIPQDSEVYPVAPADGTGAYFTGAAPSRLAFLWRSGVAPACQTTKATATSQFRGWFTWLPLSTLPDSDFSTLARLASGGGRTLTGWDLNPLDSYSEFQARLYRRLSQRSRLRLARPTSDIGLDLVDTLIYRGLQPPACWSRVLVFGFIAPW